MVVPSFYRLTQRLIKRLIERQRHGRLTTRTFTRSLNVISMVI
jgi:hypothetical protein